MINKVLNKKKTKKTKYIKKKTVIVYYVKKTTKKQETINRLALENKIGQQKSIYADYESKKPTFLQQVKNRK